MASVTDAKTGGPGFENQVEYHRVVYDFAADGGGVASKDLFTCDKSCAIVSAVVHVLTACTSGGSATVEIGTTDDANAIMTTTTGAVANLVADFTTGGAALPAWLDASDKVVMTIGTAALTAGKLEVIMGLLPLR